MSVKAATLITALLLLPTARLPAAVADSSPNGFTVKLTVTIEAPPDDVYRKFVHNVGDWWEGSHTFSGNPHNMSIDDKPGGCWCEKLSSPGGVRLGAERYGVQHMRVIYSFPGQRLVLSGGLGPLQTMALTGTMTIAFTKADGGTKLDVIYAVAGYAPDGVNALAQPVDGVLTTQITRLKNYAEHGDPAK
jgi:uncharacterized protein YndB with AHSA1/START domain